jgi:hypothetical protein
MRSDASTCALKRDQKMLISASSLVDSLLPEQITRAAKSYSSLDGYLDAACFQQNTIARNCARWCACYAMNAYSIPKLIQSGVPVDVYSVRRSDRRSLNSDFKRDAVTAIFK